MDNDVALDLDALAPQPANVKFNGQTISVNPPTLEQFVKALKLAQSLKDVDENNLDALQEYYVQAETLIKEVIPELKDKSLNYKQIMALFKLITEQGTPDDDQALVELQKKGIELDSDGQAPKDSALPEVSANS